MRGEAARVCFSFSLSFSFSVTFLVT